MPSWHDFCALTDLDERKPVIREVAGQPIGVRVWDGRVFAVMNKCGHAGGPMAFGEIHPKMASESPGDPVTVDRDNPEIRCPWHHWAFDLRTGVCTAPIRRPRARVFETRVESGRVLVLA